MWWNKMQTYNIRVPIWKTRSIGVATYRTPCLIDITYTDTKGERIYPDTYYVSTEFAEQYPVRQFGSSPEMYIIPINRLKKVSEDSV